MKKKIVLSLFALFLVFVTGATVAMLYIRNSTATLSTIVELHEIEDLRKHLLISVQTVQSDLYTVNTLLGPKVDTITENVSTLEKNARTCLGCHHNPEVSKRIEENLSLIADYQTALSYYITASANRENIDRLKSEAAAIGNQLLSATENMSLRASENLYRMTQSAVERVARVQLILFSTMLVSLFFGIMIAVHLTRSVTSPIGILVNATRALAAGQLGTTVTRQDNTEFGELSDHFNAMSVALKEGYASLEREISERRMTEAALMKSEAFLSTIFDSVRDPFCIVDRNYRVIRVNEAYAGMKARTTGDLVGKVCFKELHGRDAACNECVVAATFHSGDSCAKEKSVTSPDGSRIWLAVYTYPIMDSEGMVSHVIEYIRDITEKKKSEEALRESEQRYALAAEGANDGLFDWDLKTNRIYFSPRWKEMLGYGEHEVGDTPQEWFGRIHPDDRNQVEAKIASHIQQMNGHFECEYRMLYKDGTFGWMLSRGLAVRDKDGVACRMAGSQTDITSRKKTEEQLLHDAFHDALTGLPNRALFLDRLQHVINTSKRLTHYQYAVLFLDIDRFKVINDSLGHTIGDLLLVEVGRRITDCLRPEDTVARLGGDEFAIILENIRDMSDAADVSERIQRVLAPSFSIQGHEVFISQSIGIALNAMHYERPEQVLRDADIAMYQAKAKGKARFEFFDSAMQESVVDRLHLEADLRLAIEHKEGFFLHYQPIMSLRTQQLIGFEALVRWRHPKRGVVMPMEFIPLAEETGMIFPLGEWIIREACRQIRIWQSQYPQDPPLRMSMNISSRQFHQRNFANTLDGILRETRVVPHSIAIEITESMIMENIDIAVVTMQKLRNMGIHIHIDDFGTGYSSLSYLHHFPVNALKIDRSFIQKMSANEKEREIVKIMISLARNLNLDVIAEGVEEMGQLSEIGNMQCQYAQGYLFARPMAPDDAELWIGRERPISLRGA